LTPPKRRLLPPWSGCHPPRLGHTGQNFNGDLHPSLSHHQSISLSWASTSAYNSHTPTSLRTMHARSASSKASCIAHPLPIHYRHHIHRDILYSITHTLKTRCKPGLRTYLGKIKAHNHSLGNDLADALANQVANGHPTDTTCTTGLIRVYICQWTWPHTLVP
jgi:hypothetical protein